MEAGAKGKSSRFNARALAQPLALLVLFALTALLAVTAYRLIFSTFDTPDDEGYLIVTLRSFAQGNALYDSVYSQYGPGFYTVVGGGMKLVGVAFTSDGARWVNLALWLASTLLAGFALWRLTRNLAIAAVGLGITFLVLVSDAAEPLHPGATIGLVLMGIVVALTLDPSRLRLTLGVVGALVALLATTKVNVGALAGLSVLFAIAVSGREIRRRRGVRIGLSGLMVIVPFALLSSHLDRTDTLMFAATVAASSLALILVTLPGAGLERPNWLDVRAFALGLAGAILLFCAVPVILGTSPGGLIDGWLIDPLSHPKTAFNEVTLSTAGLVWSVAGILGATAVAVLPEQVFEGRPRQAGIALVKLAIGVGMWVLLAGAVLGAPTDLPRVLAFATPFAWLITVRPPGEPEEQHFPRVTLAALAVLQPLHAYPVPGNQLSWGVILMVFVGGVLIADAIATTQATAAPRLPAWSVAAVGTLIVVGIGSWFALQRLRPLHDLAEEQYFASVPLDLPGAERQRVDLPRAENLQALTAGIEHNCDSFLTLPGLDSLYLYTQQTPPEEMSSSWMLYLDDAEQQRIIDLVENRPRMCAVIKPDLLDFWRVYQPQAEIPDRPLVRFIENDFRVIHDYSGYELAVRR